jgi:thymidylate synthase
MFSLIVCTDECYGIGMNNGTIPFRNSADMANFKALTTNNIVIMGRKTWDSLKKPLPDRLNVVISSQGYDCIKEKLEHSECKNSPIRVFTSIEECIIELSKGEYKKQEKFIIGGATLYNYFIKNKLVQKIYHTLVNADFRCDVQMAHYNAFADFSRVNSSEVQEMGGKIQDATSGREPLTWNYDVYEFVNKEEVKFMDILEDILKNGTERLDRTNVGTKALFGKFLEFDLSNNTLPLGTTRSVPLRMVFEELMWFLRGQTDSKILEKQGINIWQGNTSREFLDSRGLLYAEGAVGPTYGHNFRHYGAPYINSDTDYTNQGYDQLSEAIRLIKEDPHSRRIMINLWNPAVLDKCALPPCLFGYQFFVEKDKATQQNTLSCLMLQRSSDISLAGFWNIVTGSLLTIMMARVTGLSPKTLKWSIGDVHIYNNQVNAVEKQLGRVPRCFPKLFFTDAAPSLENQKNITNFKFTDLKLVGYNPYPSIKSVMNI